MRKLALLGAVAAIALTSPAYAAYTITAYTANVGRAFDANASSLGLFASGTNNASSATFSYSGDLNFSNTGPQNTTTSGDLNGNFFNGSLISGYRLIYQPTTTPNYGSFATQASFLAASGSIAGFNYGSLYYIDSDSGSYGGQRLTIRHDDGVSLYAFVNGSYQQVSGYTAGPTSAITETGAALPTGTTAYRIIYGRENGTPSVLQVTAVPEPATWAMMGLGFAAVGFAARRRSKATGRAVTA